MHESVMAFVAKVAASGFGMEGKSVLEVGSYDVNGSVRSLFEGTDYLGIDIEEGPGVDQVVDLGAELPFGDSTFDLVLSTEMLEHDLKPWLSVCEWHRVLRDGGLLVVTARGFNQERGAFPFHNPPDRWRYSRDAIEALLHDAGFMEREVIRDPQVPGWFATALKS